MRDVLKLLGVVVLGLVAGFVLALIAPRRVRR